MGRHSHSLWLGTAETKKFAPLPGDLTTDVVVVGGGITGITAAWLLKRAGRKVVLVDAFDPLKGDTGHTTSHVTALIDTGYHAIARKFGRSGAKLAAESTQGALEQIDRIIRDQHIDCGFERVPAFLYAETAEQERALEQEIDATADAGLDVKPVDELPLPFSVRLAMRLENQGQFHPVEYLRPLLDALPGDGCHVFGRTRVLDVHDGTPCRVETSHGVITASSVFVAAYVPVNNKFFLITKIAPYRTYVVASRLTQPFAPGLFWDMYDPYHYTRRHRTRDGEYLIVGGKDHKVGMETDPRDAMAELREYVTERYGLTNFDYEWSGQIIEPSDGLAMIGRNSGSKHVYVATGYSGIGMTWGTLAAQIVTDLIQERANPYASLYDATRVKPLAMAKEYVSENIDFPSHFLFDRLRRPDAHALAEIPAGEGRLVDVDGRRLAVFRDEDGSVRALSPVCTHMGCHVRFNGQEKSWDCPCHGGRYDTYGRVLNGPPVHGLAAVSLEGDEAGETQPPAPDEGINR